jgi:hypothetical protein
VLASVVPVVSHCRLIFYCLLLFSTFRVLANLFLRRQSVRTVLFIVFCCDTLLFFPLVRTGECLALFAKRLDCRSKAGSHCYSPAGRRDVPDLYGEKQDHHSHFHVHKFWVKRIDFCKRPVCRFRWLKLPVRKNVCIQWENRSVSEGVNLFPRTQLSGTLHHKIWPFA